MKFSELKVGQKFKFMTLESVMTKIEMPTGGVRDGKTFGILEGDVAWPNIAALDLPVRTLQKVTKTEKKWVLKGIPTIQSGSRIKFMKDTEVYHTKIMVYDGEKYTKHGWLDAYNKAVVLSHGTAQEAWVEEDTVVEVEEWAP